MKQALKVEGMIRQITHSLLVLTIVMASLVVACAPLEPLEPSEPLEPISPPKPNLTISAEIAETGWGRDPDYDFPTYRVTFYYEIANNSNWSGQALVRVTDLDMPIYIYLEPYDRVGRNCTLDFQLGINQSGSISFFVAAGSMRAADDVWIDAVPLPRSGSRRNAQILPLYITPNHGYVRGLLAQILAHRPALRTDFGAIQQWVDDYITYKSDYSMHGVSEYYQLPYETASSRCGDCEDYAILLCSLLRAYGIPAKEIYVAFGFNADGTTAHAYLLEHWYYDEWRVIEPQSSFPLLTDIQSWLTDLEFEDACYFNDQYYFQLK